MIQFAVPVYLEYIELLERMVALFHPRNFEVARPPEHLQQLRELATDIVVIVQKNAAKDLSLSPAMHSLFKSLEVHVKSSAVEVVSPFIRDVETALIAEVRGYTFLCLSAQEKQKWEQGGDLFGPEALAAFPDAKRDMAAAVRCIAINEWTACVFHSMRVLEHGLRPMAIRFNVPFAADSWHKVIKGIEDGITDLRNKQGLTEQDRKEITYYSDAASQLRHFKDAWRNHVSHAREHYDDRDAYKVLAHVAEFMQHLAVPV